MIMDKEEFERQKAAIDWDEFYKDKKDYVSLHLINTYIMEVNILI